MHKQPRLTETALMAFLIACTIFLAYRYLTAPTALERSFPNTSARLKSEVQVLTKESVTESAQALSHVNFYFWPGAPRSVIHMDLPLPAASGQYDLEVIMSNRRFRKVLAEMAALDPKIAAEVINEEIAQAMAIYLPRYERIISTFSPQFPVGAETVGTIAFKNQTHPTNNAPLILGERLKLLALVWTSGMLGLTECRAQVEQLAQVAMEQRVALYESLDAHEVFRFDMLDRVSLYNRQILATGLIGVSGASARSETFWEEIGAEWEERDLVAYTSEVTEYDTPARFAVGRPESAEPSVNVRFVSPLSDDQFDILLSRLIAARDSSE